MTDLSVVVPVYQAEDCLQELHRRLTHVLKVLKVSYELIWVDDGSVDGSWDRMVALSRKDRKLRILRLSRNFGQQIALTAGLDMALGRHVVIMDCDLQDRPEEIPRLYAKARQGHDMVLASRGGRCDSWLKRQTSNIFYFVFNYLTGMNYDGRIGNFRVISRRVAGQFRSFRERTRFFGALLKWMGVPVVVVDVQHDPRFAGRTTYSYARLIRLGMDVCLAYSDKPLRLTVGLGFGLSALSILGGAWIFFRALVQGIPVPGWGSLIVSLYFLAGVTIGVLGMVGLYVGKIFDEVKARPLYIVLDSRNVHA
jgi:polyisoprenyl-phosphate glycosyltransferase